MNTYTYYTYYGRDRDDWSGPHTIQAESRDDAIEKAQHEWFRSSETVWKKTFKLVDNQ
jgi:hypothetical protein